MTRKSRKVRWTGSPELWAHPKFESFAILYQPEFRIGNDFMYRGEAMRVWLDRSFKEYGALNRSHFNRRWIFLGRLP